MVALLDPPETARIVKKRGAVMWLMQVVRRLAGFAYELLTNV